MKLKKITLYYREMKEWLDMTDSELDGKNVIIFRTSEGGLGIREQCHGGNPAIASGPQTA